MKEFKGTQGEWIVVREFGSYAIKIGDLPNTPIRGYSMGESQKNAKLIAAAPDLLKQLIACEKALKMEGYGELARSEINEAIEKALK